MSFDSPPLIIGHRGAAGLAPENTLAGFARAAALGVDAVELDVHCVDGHLLVIHDDSLDRTTSGCGPLAAHDIAHLRTLDAGGGNPIPLLGEVFETLPANLGINVELKGEKTAEPLFSMLRKFRRRQRDLLVSSFNVDELRRFGGLARGTIKLGALFQRWNGAIPRIATELDAWSVNLGLRAATRQHVQELRARGFKVLVYTVNDRAVAERLFSWGATGIFTDFPDRMTGAVVAAGE